MRSTGFVSSSQPARASQPQSNQSNYKAVDHQAPPSQAPPSQAPPSQRVARPRPTAFVDAYNASKPWPAQAVPGTAPRVPQLVPGMLPESEEPPLPSSQSHSQPFPLDDLVVNKSGIQRTPLTRQRNWQAVGVGRADLAPRGPSSVFSSADERLRERLRAIERDIVADSGSSAQGDGSVSTSANDTQSVNKNVGVGVNQNIASSTGASEWARWLIAGVVLMLAGGYLMSVVTGPLRLAAFVAFLAGIACVVMAIKTALSGTPGTATPSATGNSANISVEAALAQAQQAGSQQAGSQQALGTGWREPGINSGKGWDAWPSVTGMYGSATLPGAGPTQRPTQRPTMAPTMAPTRAPTKAPVVTKRPQRRNNATAEHYDVNTPVLVAGPDGPHETGPAPYGVLPQRRDQPDADPFRPPPDPMDTFEDRLRAQGSDPDSLEGPRAGVGYQRAPLPGGRQPLPASALMRAPENSNMSDTDFTEYMRRLGGEAPDQFVQAHPYYTFNAEWDKRTQIDDDQKQFGISNSPGQMNRKFPYKDPRMQQAGAKTSHLKDPPPGAVPPLEKTHPWLEHDENGSEPAALRVTPLAAEHAVATAPAGVDDGPPAPIETMSDRKRRMLAASESAPGPDASHARDLAPPRAHEASQSAAPPQNEAALHATDGGADEDGNGGFLSAFTEKPAVTEEAIEKAIQLAGRRD